jgi:hypothetical protein
MEAIRQIYESIPGTITIPPELRDRRVEVIIQPLDQNEEKKPNGAAVDENGWPIGFFEATFGSAPNLPEREAHPEFAIH